MRGFSLMPVVLAVCVVGACGGSAASVSDSDAGGASSSSSGSSSGGGTSSSGGTSSGGDASTDAKPPKDAALEANAPGCPKKFSDPPPDGHCTIGLACAYEEGTCTCLNYCGGAPPPPNEDFSHWGCTAKRTDGCPDEKPLNGSSCNSLGKSCDYGDCCIEQFVCTASKWTSGGMICPP